MRKADGFVMVCVKGGDSYYLALDQHDLVLAAWEGSGVFVKCAGLYGERWTLLRGQIESVGLVSAEAYEDAKADEVNG